MRTCQLYTGKAHLPCLISGAKVRLYCTVLGDIFPDDSPWTMKDVLNPDWLPG
jgi:hypothetical protein